VAPVFGGALHGRGFGCALQQLLEPGHDLRDRHGLQQIVVGAVGGAGVGLEGAALRVFSGGQQDRRVLQDLVGADPAADAEARALGELDVDHDHVGSQLTNGLEGTVEAQVYADTGGLQSGLNRFCEDRVAVDDEDRAAHAPRKVGGSMTGPRFAVKSAG
jgi:hypothetical protein